MGKKVKKKARSGQRERPDLSLPPKPAAIPSTSDTETHDDSVTDIKGRGLCPHVDKGINLDQISAKLKSSESLKCEDCRENSVDRRVKKGKGKHGKKGGTNSKPESKAIWICLECGQFSCGGVGLPTTPQSHAVRHAKQARHPLVIHHENHMLLWCFPCTKLIPTEIAEDKKHKDVLIEVVKILQERRSEKSATAPEDFGFRSGSVTSAIKSDYSSGIAADEGAGYTVRGMVNLGNTCFFNSIMQNLLAIDKFRDFFSKLDVSFGPLNAALRKLVIEISNGAAITSVINPRSLFGSLRTKAPQFRGYQQHDSHELLICLLDCLSTEELSARKDVKSSNISVTDPTFVDAVFGGRLSSTVSCLACGHSSTVYEPFLDLSLPLPSKRKPPTRTQLIGRGKKSKLPPKRSGRNLSKIGREASVLPGRSVAEQSTGSNSSCASSLALPSSQLVPIYGDSRSSDSTDPNSTALDMGLTADDLSRIENPKNQEPVDNAEKQSFSSDSCTWLDYIDPNPDSLSWLNYHEPIPVSHDSGAALETDGIPATQGFTNEDALQADESLAEGNLLNADSSFSDNAQHVDAFEPSVLTTQHALSQVEKQNVEPQREEKPSLECSIEEVVPSNTDRGPGSSGQICSKDPNTPGRDDEQPSQIENSKDNLLQNSKDTLLQNKENASSSGDVLGAESAISSEVLADGEDSIDFDGFGDLFNEPEVSVTFKPSVSETSDASKSGVTGNSSESDPDEVGTSDVPVSVESCLDLLTRPDLLSKDEHAWECDRCSKVLQEQRIRSRTNFQMSTSSILQNGFEDGNTSDLLDVGQTSNNVSNTNRCVATDMGDFSDDGRSLLQNRQIRENKKCTIRKDEAETKVSDFDSENFEPQMLNVSHGSLECSSFNNKNLSHGECDSDKNGFIQNNLLPAQCESEASKEWEADSKDLKVKRDATKTIRISEAPSILTIHLKRFSQDARGRLSKLNGHVNFTETIDLKPYMDPRCDDKDTLTYHLVGVVEHSGSMRGGHYVAYIRGTNRTGDSVWYHASDEDLRQVSFEEVLRSEAYILFYQRT